MPTDRRRTVVDTVQLLEGGSRTAFATMCRMPSTAEFQRQPSATDIRVIDRGGRRILHQWRNKPGGLAYEFPWVDVLELAKSASVSALKS